jgi:N-acetylneuraminic acid mutarotase
LQNLDRFCVHLATGVEDGIIVVGLDGDKRVHQQICHISLDRMNVVKTIDATPTVINVASAACVIDDTFYAVGIGLAGNELWKWIGATAAKDSDKWIRCEDMPSERYGHCAVTVDSTLYVLGGWVWADKSVFTSVLSYSTQTQKWSTAGQLVCAVYLVASVAYKDSIYVFAGLDKDNKQAAHVQNYNITQQTCTLLSSAMPRAYCHMRAVLWQTSAVLLGHNTCFIYNFETQSWQERMQFKTNVICFGLVLDNQSLYVVGGILTDEIKTVSVLDIMEDKPSAWKHHAKLPKAVDVYSYGLMPLKFGP